MRFTLENFVGVYIISIDQAKVRNQEQPSFFFFFVFVFVFVACKLKELRIVVHGTKYMGLGILKKRSPAQSPRRSLHWSPTLPRILKPSAANCLLLSDLNIVAPTPLNSALLHTSRKFVIISSQKEK